MLVGLHPFEDSYISRRAYEHEVNNFADYKYEDSLSTIIKVRERNVDKPMARHNEVVVFFFDREK